MFILVLIYLLSYAVGLLAMGYAAVHTAQYAGAELQFVSIMGGVTILLSGFGCIIFGALVHAADRALNLLKEIRDNQSNEWARKVRPTAEEINETKKEIDKAHKRQSFSATS